MQILGQIEARPVVGATWNEAKAFWFRVIGYRCYADEVRPVAEVPLGSAQLKEGELKLALQIVEQLEANEFKPDLYEDDVRKRMLHAIERKVEGHEITAEPEEEPKAQVIDLMEALKASLARSQGDRKPAKRAVRATSPARAKSVKRARS